MGRTSSSPPITPVSSATGLTGARKLAPRLVDLQKSGLPGAAEKMQLCVSTLEFGSAPPPPFAATFTLAPKLAAVGGAGVSNALPPLFSFAHHALFIQPSARHS